MAARMRPGRTGRVIHNRVRVLRVEAGLSRAQLADLVGVNSQTIGALERGDHYPSLNLAMSVCEVFEIPIEAAFSREPFESIGASYRRGREATDALA